MTNAALIEIEEIVVTDGASVAMHCNRCGVDKANPYIVANPGHECMAVGRGAHVWVVSEDANDESFAICDRLDDLED